MNNSPVVIIGAGITGLTIAYYLKKANVPFVVLEKLDRVGGVINTQTENGFTYESGPNSGIISHPEVVQLFDELGDSLQLEKGNDLVKVRYVLKKGEWHALPYSPQTAISTPLFSLKDKFRILGEPFRSKGTDPNESLGDMVKRRLGKSFLDYAIDPFVLGIYAGDPGRLVTRFAFPKLYNLEQNYGSFIKGTIKKRKDPKSELEKRTDRSVFSFKGGLSQLIQTLYQKVGNENVELSILDIKVKPSGDQSFEIKYVKDGEVILVKASQLISTIGANGLDELLPFIEPERLTDLINLPYARVVEVSLGFDKWEGRPLDGFGGLIPHKENRQVLGVLFMSSLFSNRAPEGGALLTVFMGGVRNDAICDLTDEELLHVLENEIIDLMELPRFNPDVIKLKRYTKAIPQYGIESEVRLAAIAKVEDKYPGLTLAGNIKDGIGMADRIKQATQIADSIIKQYNNA